MENMEEILNVNNPANVLILAYIYLPFVYFYKLFACMNYGNPI